MKKRLLPITLLAGFVVGLGPASTAQAGWTKGDIFAAVGDGKVNVYTPTGTFIQTLDEGTGSQFTTGLTFDHAGNLYVTNAFSQTISKFDANGNLVAATWASSGGLNNPESIVWNGANTTAYVGGTHGGAILSFDSSGTMTGTILNPGGDWVDLAADQHTLLFTDESTRVGSVDINGTPNPDFSNSIPTFADYALRILKNGDVLVADTDRVVLLDPSGNVIRTYTTAGVQLLFALNVLPDQTSFLTGDLNTGEIYQFNVATGALEMSFNSSPFTSLAGLAVFGEFQSGGGGGGGETPEPTTMVLVGTGVSALLLKKRKKN